MVGGGVGRETKEGPQDWMIRTEGRLVSKCAVMDKGMSVCGEVRRRQWSALIWEGKGG